MAPLLAAIWPASAGLGRLRAQRRPCRYEAYVPDSIEDLELALPSDVDADISDAERAIQRPNAAEVP